MAVQRRVNFLSQQRVDVPDMRSIESSVSNDFDQLIQGFVTGTTQGYIMRGFNILMAGSIGSASSSLLMQVDPGAVLHITASQSGTIMMVPAGTPAQQLNQATNPANVTGAFTPSSINYVTIDYTRFIDSTTSAQVYIWDPSSNTETAKFAPRAQILQFVINISTSTPTANQLPIATVLTDSANLVISITDARWMFCSLGTGGLTPNPSYSYPWTQGRTENPITSVSDSIDPFSGNDKSIGSLKELLNAMLTTFKEIKGTPYWFTAGSTSSLPAIYQNAELNVLYGGTWVHSALGKLKLEGGSKLARFGFSNQLVLSPFGPLTSTESLTATVSGNTVVTFSTPAVNTNNIGDTVTIGASTLDINTVTSQSIVDVDEPGFTNGSGQAATLKHYASFNLNSNQVLYVLFPSSDTAVTYGYGADATNPVLPKQISSVTTSTITVATGGNYVAGPGNILAHGQTFSYTSYNSITGVFSGLSPDPFTTVFNNDYVYQLDSSGVGYYHYSSPLVVPGIDPLGVSLGAERVLWLAFYDGSSQIFLRDEKLSVGEAIAVGDTISTSIMAYIGQPNQATNNPSYSSDIRGVANENLTSRIGYLTDAIGDEQEDRSAYIRSDAAITWNGSTITFTQPIIIEITNNKLGTLTTHTILASASPITLVSNASVWVSISRASTSENLTVKIDPTTPIPAQSEANKDVFVLFKRHDVGAIHYLELPFSKQVLQPNDSSNLGSTISQNLYTTVLGTPDSNTAPAYSSNIRGTANETLVSRSGQLTDAVGDEQEDRSAYIKSDNQVTWDGSKLLLIDTSPSSNIDLKIVNTKAGGAVSVHTILASAWPSGISLADGQYGWVLINRLSSSENVTLNITSASGIPAQTEANKDVFILFNAHLQSGADFLYLPFSKQVIAPGQTVYLGASGTGTGTGGGDFGLDSLTYNSSFADSFDTLPSLSSTAVNTASGFTNATYSVVNKYFSINYDGTKSLTGIGTAVTLNSAPSFTVVAGDIIVFNSQARKITLVTNQTTFTIETAFVTNPSSSTCMISQAVYTVDINNYTNNSTQEAISSAFPGSTVGDVLVDYDDSSTTLPNLTGTALIAYTASATGTVSDYTTVNSRTVITSIEPIVSLPTVGSSLYLRFFANPALGAVSGTANLLEYEAFLHNSNSLSNTGFALSQAYCFTNGSEATVNCSQPTVVSGKTQISGLPLYSVGLNLGQANGQLFVVINGQKIPRFTSGVTAPGDAYYTEINTNTIQLDSDYSGYAFSVEIIRWIGVIDSNNQNSSRISAQHTFVVGSAVDVASGVANFSSLVSALTASPTNANIQVLASYNTVEAITVSNPVTILGQGRGTQIGGTLAISSQFSSIKNMRFNANVTISGTSNYVRECFSAPGVTVTETTPGSNSLLIIGE